MYQNVKNTQAKSKLSKLLAMENITVINQPGVSTASFDVKNRTLTMPVWGDMSQHLYDMLTVHEVGHALDTKHEDWMNAQERLAEKFPDVRRDTIRDFLNVVEDVRVDKRQKRRYPGSRRDYAKGYQELWDKNFFGVNTPREANKMLFIDRINIYFKTGAFSGVKFSKAEQKFIKRLDNIETWDEVEQIVSELIPFCAIEMAASKKVKFDSSQFDGMFTDLDVEEVLTELEAEAEAEAVEAAELGLDGDDEDGEDADWDDDDDDDADDSDDDAEEEDDIIQEGEDFESGHQEVFDDPETIEVDDEQDEALNEAKKNAGRAGEGIDLSDIFKNLESGTAVTFEKAKEGLVVNTNKEYYFFKLPEPTEYSITSASKVHAALSAEEVFVKNREKHQEELNRYRRDENSTISFMVKEFEMKKRAKQYSRTRVSRTGALDMSKLHAYRTSEDIFLQKEILADSKNHGFVMIVDWSTSMSSVAHRIIKQTITMMLFCQKVQIPFEVYLFRDARVKGSESWATRNATVFDAENDIWKGNASQDKDGFEFDEACLRQLATSSMSKTELNKAMLNMWTLSKVRSVNEPMTGTPLLEAIHLSRYVVKNFQKRHNPEVTNLIFLTDGDGSSIRAKVTHSEKPYYDHVYHVQDDETKKNYRVGTGYTSYAQWEKLLMDIIRETTGANIIGFYVNDGWGSTAKNLRYKWLSSENDTVTKEKLRQYKNENFFTCRKTGYDTFYVLNGAGMNINKATDKMVVNTKTQHQIAKSFSQYQNGKKYNRVMLKNFVDQISK